MHPLGPIEETARIYCDPNKKICEVTNEFLAQGSKYSDAHYRELLAEEATSAGTELLSALELLEQFPKSVTFYGGVNISEGTPYYEKTRRLAGMICREGFAVLTGGGPGVMQAGNRGAYEACGYSIGFNIELPFEQVLNPYVTHGQNFRYFFTRKTAMQFSSEVAIFMPGGFGTFDELFGQITLIQTKKCPPIPLILVGSDFWGPLDTYIKTVLRDTFHTIRPGDDELYTIVDDEDVVLEIVKKAPHRNTYMELEKDISEHAAREAAAAVVK
jgi:uncharacterized protein (TIGR00730 family)